MELDYIVIRFVLHVCKQAAVGCLSLEMSIQRCAFCRDVQKDTRGSAGMDEGDDDIYIGSKLSARHILAVCVDREFMDIAKVC